MRDDPKKGDAMMHSTPTPSDTLPMVDVGTLASLLAEARSAIAHDPSGADRMIERAALMLRPRSTDSMPGAMLLSGGLAPWQIRKVRNYVAEHLGERIATTDLADAAELSASHFARAFKVSLGLSPHGYVTEQRIARARALIFGTDLPLCEVALLCGFADQAHLSRLFRRLVGQSPAAWRRANAERDAA
jgi:transcriptional regulator GlxA family with amidase domain